MHTITRVDALDDYRWVFDEPSRGLRQEPFVAGIPQMMDKLVVGIPNAEQGFKLIFSAQEALT